MNVADVMTSRADTVTVGIPGTRDDVLEILRDGTFSSVPVVKQTDGGEEYRGLVTRDALIDNPDEDQLALLVEEVTTTTADTPLSEVATRMRETGDRRMPVVDGGLEGIITITDVVRAVAAGHLPGDATVESVAGQAVNTVYAGTPLTVAERELSFAGVPYAVVLGEDADPAGMLTEVDVIAVARVVEGEAGTGDSIANQDDEWAWEGIKAVGNRYTPTRNVEIPAEPVSEFMTEDLVTVGKRTTIQDAAQLLIEHDIEQIPVVTGDELYGLVRDVDLLEAL